MAQIERTEKSHQQIISSGKFWKLAKHESLLVKTAFFNVVASLIDNATILLKGEKKRTMTAIMNSLDETEPGLLAAVWESMLVAINKIEVSILRSASNGTDRPFSLTVFSFDRIGISR